MSRLQQRQHLSSPRLSSRLLLHRYCSSVLDSTHTRTQYSPQFFTVLYRIRVVSCHSEETRLCSVTLSVTTANPWALCQVACICDKARRERGPKPTPRRIASVLWIVAMDMETEKQQQQTRCPPWLQAAIAGSPVTPSLHSHLCFFNCSFSLA